MIEKERALRETLSSLGSVIVAYSGGVDSAYLACVANDTLGPRALAVTADSPSYPEHHRQMAAHESPSSSACATRSSRPRELERPEYRANPANRCYFCKHELYTHLSRIAAERRAVVVDGNNADDRGDYRPGPAGGARVRRAQPARRGRISSKDEIRELSRPPGLPTWDEPASACLSSRIPYHSRSDRRKAAHRSNAPSRRCARSASASAACVTTTISRGSRFGRDELARALEPEIARGDRPRAEGRRLPLRDDRSPGLPHGQPERRAAAASRA